MNAGTEVQHQYAPGPGASPSPSAPAPKEPTPIKSACPRHAAVPHHIEDGDIFALLVSFEMAHPWLSALD